MREMFERVMHAMGWMPAERERVLSEQLQVALDEKAVAEQIARALHSNVMRAESSWERAEARIRELEREFDGTAVLFGGRNLMVRAIANRKLQELHERADRIAQR